MPPKRNILDNDGFAVPYLHRKMCKTVPSSNRIRSESDDPASRETSPADLSSSSLNRAHSANEMREVTDTEWKYGRNRFGKEKTHLIVFEPGNLIFARVYSLCNGVYWRCMGCRRNNNKSSRAEFIDKHLHVPVTEFHRCKPKKYIQIREDQKKLEKKFAAVCLIVENRNVEEPEETITEHVDNVVFNHPSSEWLREKCEVIGIEYSKDAIQVWSKCNIDEVTTTSLPDDVEVEATTVSECISMLFTGKKNSAAKIKNLWNKNFSSNFELLGKFKSLDFAKISREILDDIIFADEITDFHLEFFSRWLKFRIGIFTENRWMHYGNWSSSDYKTMTILMKKENINYQIILTLD